jgi:hypothetical protein
MWKVLLLFVIICFAVSQKKLPPNVFSAILKKTQKFNKMKASSYVVLYKSDKETADALSSELNCSALNINSYKATSDYNYIIFIDASGEEIEEIRKKDTSILSVAYSATQIMDVSLSFNLKHDDKPEIFINFKRAKKEADFISAFLRLATVVNK